MHRLALQLGWSVEQLRRDMTAAEFADWMIYHGVEPFGSPTDDDRFDAVASAAGAAAGVKIKRGDWFSRFTDDGRPPVVDPNRWREVRDGFTPYVAKSEGGK